MNPNLPPNIAIYARYSTDLQNPSSVDDQVALCRNLIRDQFGVDPSSAAVFSDPAISGATLEQRPGMRQLMQAARAGAVSLVVAEGLDRLSRNLKDIAAIHETLSYHGVTIWTAHEGKVSELHVGLKGTMNALFLKDLKDKIRRGQTAAILAGFSASCCPYGYRVVRGVVDAKGNNVNGIREIVASEAAVIRRIYREYTEGRKLTEIVAGLNGDGIPSPRGRAWRTNTLVASRAKGSGILMNEVYIGNIVYNRLHMTRHPVTGKVHGVLRPPGEWTRSHLESLRIIDDATWEKARARLRHAAETDKAKKRKMPAVLNSHNQHALTGWVRCGWCGGPKSLANDNRYLCSMHRYARKCKNARGTKEPILLAAVFDALRERILIGPRFRDPLMRAFAREIEADTALRREEADIKAKIARLLEAIEMGVGREHSTARIIALQDDLRGVREAMRVKVAPELPGESEIRNRFLAAIHAAERGDIVGQRVMFGHLLKAVTLTPIPGQYRGETLKVELREEGWAEFWRTIGGE